MSYDLNTTSDFLPERDVFFISVDMSDYLLEYYQHRKDISTNISAEQDEKLKELITCFAIHMTAHAAFENHAWTITLVSEPPYSLFVTGNSGELDEGGVSHGFLVGNILTENIRHVDINGIHAQSQVRGETFNSYIKSENSNIRELVESFYSQSEQRPIRISLSSNSDTAIAMVALNGCDLEWFENVDLEDFAGKLQDKDKSRMRTCKFAFSCDCSPEKLLPFFNSLTKEAVDELYGDDQELLITCPRCGRQFNIDREQISTKEIEQEN